ncbi:YidC/Oxa1 family membrane protein insertase [Raineyella antarctica]|uniref:Membrane protein insertase YidC n=1 Tax=Raineyella antarctica TaxID=1577474 RepID=A0A1G6HTR3_9ACTN|nr:membrane protein insertase YidC [Raineyella antarctica]SDB97584.1 YidC/Oxa1 family membrane protein insertase [Raineyella antarctica]
MELLQPLLIPLAGINDFFSTVAQPLYWVVSGIMVGFHKLLSPVLGTSSGWTWGLSIVLLTLVVRVAMIPLFMRQIQSTRGMQELQPKLKELQKKYADDRDRLGQETMKLYKDEGVNPMASCLPLLIQMPFFLSLYRVIDGASRGVARGSWLSGPEHQALLDSLTHATIFGVPLSGKFWPMVDGFSGVQVLTGLMTLVMVVAQFLTQRQMFTQNMSPQAMEGPMAQQQKMMLYLFPAMYIFFGATIPLGVLIYLLTTTLWSMGQQEWIIRNNPTAGTPAYLAWEERLAAKGINPRKVRPGDKLTRARIAELKEEEAVEAAARAEEAGKQPKKLKAAPPTVQRNQPAQKPRAQRGPNQKKK